MTENEKANFQTEILGLMEGNERLVGQLYDIYSKKLPEIKSFWTGLADEEEIHAGWILTLSKKTKSGEVYFDSTRFPKAAIENIRDYLKEKIEFAEKEQEPDLIKALALTVDIEKSLLENKFFEVFKADSAEMRIVLDNLRINTQAHLESAEKMLEKCKKERV